MKENIDISEFDNIFRQQLENASATPPAGVWEGISSSLSATTATSATIAVKTAIWLKIGIGVIASAAIASAVYIATDHSAPDINKETVVVTAPVQEQPTLNEPVTVIPENKVTESSATFKKEGHKVEKDVEKQAVSKDEQLDNSPVEQKNEPEPLEFKAPLTDTEKPVMDMSDEKPAVSDKVKTESSAVSKYEIPKKKGDSVLNVPNAFTPNSDGYNDGYLIDIKGEESVKIMIFDLNGNQVFETTDKTVAWNCIKPGGDEYPNGRYVVKVIYKFPGSPEKIKTEILQLIR